VSNVFDIMTVAHEFEICHTILMARERHSRTKRQGASAPVSPLNPSERARDQGLSIGFAIRARRRKLGLTLRELAEGSGLSAPFISQAERGLTTPSVISLLHLARAMKVEIGHFIDVPKGGRTIRRANDPEYIELGPKVRHIVLSGSLDDPKMETLIILLEPGVAHPTVRREGEGFYYLLEGKVNFQIEDDIYVLSTGDSAHFDQRLRYTMVNEGPKTARVLWVGTPPLFEHRNREQSR
jgi:transcriptional regulator with XRE-family HTH domain